MKKWYKNHLDALKKEGQKADLQTKSGHSFDTRKLQAPPKVFRDPVAVGKRTRNKTFGA